MMIPSQRWRNKMQTVVYKQSVLWLRTAAATAAILAILAIRATHLARDQAAGVPAAGRHVSLRRPLALGVGLFVLELLVIGHQPKRRNNLTPNAPHAQPPTRTTAGTGDQSAVGSTQQCNRPLNDASQSDKQKRRQHHANRQCRYVIPRVLTAPKPKVRAFRTRLRGQHAVATRRREQARASRIDPILQV